ncbi:hypothetical protein ACNF42_07315 [Cuniculiplasma sp. SKW3]|uniref:hypothetical protein n=1 Tax=Cuniculiplasma sp. SKW3 TaxID=3400170 RepID=UPI003FCFBE7D
MSYFYHDVIKSWFIAFPEEVVDILKRKGKKWIWLQGKDIKGKEETYAKDKSWNKKPEERKSVFYDVIYSLKVPLKKYPASLRPYFIYIEIKTGKYREEWVEQKNRQMELSTYAKIFSTFEDCSRFDSERMYLWVVPESELENTLRGFIESDKMEDLKRVNRRLFILPLEWFKEEILNSIEECEKKLKEL